MKLVIVVSVSFALLCSCGDGNLDDTIFIDDDSNELVNYSRFFSDVDFVKLETNQKSLISGLMKVEVDGDRIFVLDSRASKVLIFNRQGSFVGEIGKRGNGPGEVKKISAFSLDRGNKCVHINDRPSQKIVIFDYSGNYLSDHPGMFATGFEFLNEEVNVFYSYNSQFLVSGSAELKEDLLLLDNEGNILKKYNAGSINRGLQLNTYTNLYKDFEGSIYLMPVFDKSLFRINIDLSMEKIAEFEFKNNPPESFLIESNSTRMFMESIKGANYVNRPQRIIVAGDLISFMFIKGIQAKTVFCNKKTNEVFVVGEENWTNDINSIHSVFFVGAFENGMIQAVTPRDLAESYNAIIKSPEKYSLSKSSRKMSELFSIVRSAEEDDNQVLLFYSFKK